MEGDYIVVEDTNPYTFLVVSESTLQCLTSGYAKVGEAEGVSFRNYDDFYAVDSFWL